MSIHIEEEIKDFLNIKNGLSPKRGRYKKIKDEKGNCLWHYWAENEKPENIWDKWSHKLKTENVMEKNLNNETVIDRLVILNKEAAFNLLIKEFNICDIREFKTNNDETLLHLAVWSGNENIIDKVLELYGDHLPLFIDKQNIDGETALMIAIHKENINIIRKLLLSGANPNIQDNKLKNCMHHAADTGDIDIYSLLEEAGGEIDSLDILKRTAEDIFEKQKNKGSKELEYIKNHWFKQYEKRTSV